MTTQRIPRKSAISLLRQVRAYCKREGIDHTQLTNELDGVQHSTVRRWLLPRDAGGVDNLKFSSELLLRAWLESQPTKCVSGKEQQLDLPLQAQATPLNSEQHIAKLQQVVRAQAELIQELLGGAQA